MNDVSAARWLGTILAAATIAVYAQVVHHDFVNWDDPEYVVQNPVVSKGLSLEGVAWAFANRHGATWHPITSLSHMLDCQLYGLWPGGHHLTSVLLHVGATLLLLGMLCALTGEPAPSAFVAGAFALHPLRAESVAWVSERKDVLAAVLWMSTMWLYARWATRPSPRRYGALVVTFMLALMAKPMVVTLPLVLLLIDAWPLGRRVSLRQRIVEKLPLLALAGASSLVTFVTQQRAGGVASLAKVSVADRLANATVAYAWYVEKTVWPSDLAVFYPLRLPIPLWKVALSGLFVACVTAVAWRARRTRPWVFVGWLWYLVALLPVLGLVRVGEQAVADRYSYIPGVGLSLMVAWSGLELVRRRPAMQPVVGTVATVVLVALAAASWVQVGYWRNDVTLYEHALAVTEDNYVAHTNLGTALLAQNRVPEALQHYQEALRIDPKSAQAHENLGVALAASGDAVAALVAFQRALELDDRDAGTHVRAADVLAGEGRLAEAVAHYRAAAALEPASALVHSNLGFLLAAQGNLDEAVDHYAAALREDPNLAPAHNNLGLALESLGRRDEALRHYSRAVELAPADLQNRLNHARALARSGRRGDAIGELREVLRRQPDWPPAEQDLIRLLAADADPARRTEAVALAETLVRRTAAPDAELLSTLAVAYEGAARFADALGVWGDAITAARAGGRTDLLPGLEAAVAACRARSAP